MFRCGRGTVASVVVAAIVWSAPAPASAEIARPPGANPSNRGYELVSLPETYGTAMYSGYGDDFPQGLRSPAVARAGGRAFVSSAALPIRGQRDSGGVSAFASVRGATGVWTQTFAGLPERRSPYDSTATPIGWTPDLTTVLWRTKGLPDPADPSPAPEAFGLQRQALGGGSREQYRTGSYSQSSDLGDARNVVSTDGRTVTFTLGNVSFAAGTPASSVYQRTDDGPVRLVSVGVGGAPVANAGLERVSSDASRVLFTSDDGSGSLKRLYLRDGTTTLAVDAGSPEPSGARTNTQFLGASADLRTVVFITRDRLLPADTDADADVYRWTEGAPLQLVTRGPVSGGNGPSSACPANIPFTQVGSPAQGCDVALLGASPSTDTVYFVSPEVLDGATGAVAGEANVYERRGTGTIRYVTRLDGSDQVLVQLGPPSPSGDRETSTEDDGSLLVLTRRNPATGATYAKPQLLRVDPATASPTCVSCTASGGSADAAALATRIDLTVTSPEHNATADGRRVFFETAARLATEDRNSAIDVYEYDAVTGARSLVSAGSGVSDSAFYGVSDDGTDVMFGTRDSLVAGDRNGAIYKVYDARSGGGQEKPSTVPSEPCGDACDGPLAPAAPAFAEPGSLLGAGGGNVKGTPAVRLVVGSVSASQRRALVRTGRLTLKVRTSAASTVRVRARARVGRATTTVGSGSVRLRRAGTAHVTVRLSAAARRALRSKGALRVSLTISATGGAASKKVSLSLRATTNAKAGAR